MIAELESWEKDYGWWNNKGIVSLKEEENQPLSEKEIALIDACDACIGRSSSVIDKEDSTLNRKSVIEAFKQSCPCWSRYKQDRVCNEKNGKCNCEYLKEFISLIDKK